MDRSPPTSSALLSLCNLSNELSSEDRALRLDKLKSWCIQYPSKISDLLALSIHRDKKTGCMPLHWLAGTGCNEAIEYILSFANDHDIDILSVDQPALHPSTNRTPLHYAARNGHLSTCKLLIEQYNANPHPKCGRGGVTPLQLAVWQNQLKVVQYLVDVNGEEIVHERNGFNCGLVHWLGLVPRKRWDSSIDNDDNDTADGLGVLPLARYLHSLGISYESTIQNSNTQGHSPNHKAAWGGNLSLLQYFRDEHNVYDTYQDEAGNYCADIAKMRGNTKCYQWLLEHGSGDRADSYKVLGLDVGVDMDTVRSRYFELARSSHPDKINQYNNNDSNDEKKEDIVDEFVKIKAAYEHLTKEEGIGKQSNPKYDELKLLEDHRRIKSDNNEDGGDDDDKFVARMIAVISDYGDDGFPVSLIARRWNQIWPDRPFPTEYVTERTVQCSTEKNASGMMVVRKKVNLLKWLKWKCKGSRIYFKQSKGDVLAFDGSTRTKEEDE